MNITPNILLSSTVEIPQSENTKPALYVNKDFTSEINTLLTTRSLTTQITKDVIPANAIQTIINAVAANNEIKVNKIINEYNLDSLAKLKFDFKTENNITYKNINLFFLACRSGCIKMARELINNKNININEATNCCKNGTNGRTALIIASGSHVEIVKLLLEHNAKIDIKDEAGAEAVKYSLAMGSSNIDRCYEIQNLLHNSKQKLGLITNCYNLEVKTHSGCVTINYFNNNQDFIITFFHQDDNKNILDLENRASNTFIQSFLDAFKPYIITAPSKPVGNNIIKMLTKLNQNTNVSIKFNRLETDPYIIEGINMDIYEQQNGDCQVKDSFDINFRDQLVGDYNNHMNLIESMIPPTAIYTNNFKVLY